MGKIPFSIRVALWSFILGGSILVGFSFATLWFVYQQKIELIDSQVRNFTNRLPANPSGRAGQQRLEDAKDNAFEGQEVHFLVYGSTGNLIFQTPNWPSELASFKIAGAAPIDQSPRGSRPGPGHGRHLSAARDFHFQSAQTDIGNWRIGSFILDDFQYQVFFSLNSVRAEMNVLIQRLGLILVGAAAILAAGSWILAVRAIHPLHNISSVAEKIINGSISERITTSNKSPEIDRVIQLLNKTLDSLEASYKQALSFSAHASHELKTPLTLMQNDILSRLEKVSTESEEARFCAEVLDHLARLKHISQGLLLLAKADAGQLPVAKESFDLAELCRELCGDAQSLLEEYPGDHFFQTDIISELKVNSDPFLVRTILFNLLINAVKHGSFPKKIIVKLWKEKQTVWFQVANHGRPIPKEEKDKIFDRFFRGTVKEGSVSGSDSGSGLGLSIAKEFASALGGSITLDEAEPDWIRFTVSFPV